HNPDWERKRPKFEPRGVTATELVHEKGWAKFDLLLGMSQRPAGLNTTWEYSSELFDPSTAVRMGRHFEKLLESIAANPENSISPRGHQAGRAPCPTRPDVSRRAHRVHAAGRPAHGARHHGRRAAARRRARRRSLLGVGRARGRIARAAPDGRRLRRSRLCDLY